MSEYHPEKWVVLTCVDKDGSSIDKIFSGNYGGYLGGDDWRLSSGITEWEEGEDTITAVNISGSVYTLDKARYGMTVYMASKLQGFTNLIESQEERGQMSMTVREETFDTD